MEFNYIVNPKSGKKVSIDSKIGTKILLNYVNLIGGKREKISIRNKKIGKKGGASKQELSLDKIIEPWAHRVDTYVKEDVGEEEYICSNRAANLKVGPRVIAYDKDRRSMVSVAGTVLNEFPEEVTDSVAEDIAGLAVKISRAGLFHNDFHAGNIVYINNILVAIDWEDSETSDPDNWVKSSCAMVRKIIKLPWIDQLVRVDELIKAQTLDIDADERDVLRQRMEVLLNRKNVFSKGRKKIRIALEKIIRSITGDKNYQCIDPFIAIRKMGREKLKAHMQAFRKRAQAKRLAKSHPPPACAVS